jgi:hypothetical protein
VYITSSHLDTEWIEIPDGLALCPLPVIIEAQQVEQVVAIIVEAGPQDVHLRLADGRRSLVLHVVDVDHLLPNLVLVLVAVGERGGDVVLHLGRGGLPRDPEVGLHADGDAEGEESCPPRRWSRPLPDCWTWPSRRRRTR